MKCPRCAERLELVDEGVWTCPACTMVVIDGPAACETCGEVMAKHVFPIRHPKRLGGVPCPLCGGKRHRFSNDTIEECQRAQWESAGSEQSFEMWLATNLAKPHVYLNREYPSLLAGSVDAERLLRQQAREAKNRAKTK